MVGESNQNIVLIQIDASSFAKFEISRVDCTKIYHKLQNWEKMLCCSFETNNLVNIAFAPLEEMLYLSQWFTEACEKAFL